MKNKIMNKKDPFKITMIFLISQNKKLKNVFIVAFYDLFLYSTNRFANERNKQREFLWFFSYNNNNNRSSIIRNEKNIKQATTNCVLEVKIHRKILILHFEQISCAFFMVFLFL